MLAKNFDSWIFFLRASRDGSQNRSFLAFGIDGRSFFLFALRATKKLDAWERQGMEDGGGEEGQEELCFVCLQGANYFGHGAAL